ncbi:hypothetical protein GBA52_028306 [Prunus armeniaca]|nr:hypothetical protein GBA52_028306 [Prunus armeniaca]
MEFNLKTKSDWSSDWRSFTKTYRKKQKFEDAVASLNSLLRDHYASAFPFPSEIVLRRRLPSRHCLEDPVHLAGFLGRRTHPIPARPIPRFRPAEKAHLLSCISEAQQVVHQENDPPQPSSSPNQGS